jgi:predicted ATP-dependent endonuclease of OLD family
MKLLKARVMNYKSIEDSGWVTIDNVTCLVGKNESGKTAFLQALQKLSPMEGIIGDFDTLEYPRKSYAKYRQIHDENPADVVSAEFELSEDEIAEIESNLGKKTIQSNIIKTTKNYKNSVNWELQIDEQIVIDNVITNSELTQDFKQQITEIKEMNELILFFENIDDKPDSVEPFLSFIKSQFSEGLDNHIVNNYLKNFVPRFVYFSDYSTMKGRISIEILKQKRDAGELNDADRAFISLLSIAGTKLEDFEVQLNYERLKAELEAASISITDEIFEFWSQNKQLEVEFDISSANPSDLPPLNTGTILHIRIKNNRHRVTVPFDERSRGFVWFFSFLAYFSQMERQDSNLILLLDEPGLSLHAKAQNDFLRLIDEKLAPKHQVIYTTHSPFMINPSNFKNVRTVQDVDEKGTIISEDVLRNDRDTVFPLQAALGYELAQTLFIGPNCLLVEGPSDLIYLQILSEAVINKGFDGLDPSWVIVPVGGADKLSTFVSLLGSNKLNLVVLIDISSKNKQRIQNLQDNAMLGHNNLIQMSEITGIKNSDIEDIFEPTFYLKLVNGAYTNELTKEISMESFSNENPRIVKRIEDYFNDNDITGGHFNHYSPAVYFLKEQVNLGEELDVSTIERAKSLFEKINELL